MSSHDVTPETPNDRSQVPDAETTDAIIEEMQRLQERLNELQESLEGDARVQPEGRAARRPFTVQLRFITDFDIASGQAVDLSETGMAIHVNTPMPFALRYEEGDELVTRFATLVYATKEPEGGHRLGFQFTDKDPHERF